MGFLEVIGLGTLVYFIHQYIVIPKKEKEEKKNNLINEKVNVLRNWHPEIKNMFLNYKNQQIQQLNFEKELYKETHGQPYSGDKGGYILIFGKPTFTFNRNQILKFETSIINKINELETIPEEKRKIDEIIQRIKNA